jgi:His/Glu/Gln/Arg/opine family amino acid ABC transporter permease subunit
VVHLRDCSFALVIALVEGALLAVLRAFGPKPVAALARSIVDIGRSFPLLVAIFVVYVTITALWFPIDPLFAGTLTLGAKLGFYMAELFRSGLMSVPRGIAEAAYALGMSPFRVQHRVILPVATRIMLPAIGQYSVVMVLDTSYVSVIGAPELTNTSSKIIDLYFSTDLWAFVAITYFLIAFPLSRLFVLMEKRLAFTL